MFPDFIWFGTDCRQNKRIVIEHKNISVAVMNMMSGLTFDLPLVTINLVTWMPDAVAFANTRLRLDKQIYVLLYIIGNDHKYHLDS